MKCLPASSSIQIDKEVGILFKKCLNMVFFMAPLIGNNKSLIIKDKKAYLQCVGIGQLPGNEPRRLQLLESF